MKRFLLILFLPSLLFAGEIADWRFYQTDLQSATSAYDLSGYGRTATITAGTGGFTTDYLSVANRAYDFDGANSKWDTGSDWIGTTALTFTGWFYADGYGEGTAGRMFENGKCLMGISVANGGDAYFGSNAGVEPTVRSGAGSIPLGEWVYIAVTRDAAGATNFYIGDDDFTTPPALSGSADQASGTPNAGTNDVNLGNNEAGDRTFDGKLTNYHFNNTEDAAVAIADYYKYNPVLELSTGTGNLELSTGTGNAELGN